jgi:hypothetical protein
MPAGFCATTRLMNDAYRCGSSFGIVAALLRRLAHLRIAQVGEVRVVHLHVRAAGGGERRSSSP